MLLSGILLEYLVDVIILCLNNTIPIPSISYLLTIVSVSFYLRHEAERLEQEAKGRLERQKITDEAEAERSRKELLELQAQSAAVESTGQAKAEAQSRAEAARIQGEAAVQQAKLKAEATTIEAVSLLRESRPKPRSPYTTRHVVVFIVMNVVSH